MGAPRGPLDPTAWDERYRTGDTPWDKGEPSPGLVDFLAQESYTPGTVLVPGCGRGHDCRALTERGFDVTGLDVSAAAVGDLRGGERLRFVVGDFLTHTDRYDWIFEHTCFCAIHPDWRDRYVEAAARCLKPGGSVLGIFFTFHAEQGPPFGATREELVARFSPRFELVQEKVPRSWPNRQGEELLMWWRRKPS